MKGSEFYQKAAVMDTLAFLMCVPANWLAVALLTPRICAQTLGQSTGLWINAASLSGLGGAW